MVLQVAKDEDKDVEFSDVQLPLPKVSQHMDEEKAEEEMPSVRTRKKSSDACKIGSIILNLLLIIAIAVLTVKVCKYHNELEDIKDRDEYVISPNEAYEKDRNFNLKGFVGDEVHQKINELWGENDDDWFKNGGVKFLVCFRKTKGDYWLRG